MLKHALIAATLVTTTLAGAPLATAGNSDSDSGRQRKAEVLRSDAPVDRHVVRDRRPGRGHDDRDSHVRGAYPPWRHRRPAAYGHRPHDHRHPGYYCRHCHFRTDSRDAFFHHVHHRHHVPWHRVGAYLAWRPFHFFFSFDGH